MWGVARWFAYGFAATLGLFTASAVAQKYEEWTKIDDIWEPS